MKATNCVSNLQGRDRDEAANAQKTLPSSNDLDAVVEEDRIKEVTKKNLQQSL